MTTSGLSDAASGVAPSGAVRYATGEVFSEYETGRNHAILTALSRASYGRAFQPGCSIGELTAQLARRCVQVVATDFLPRFVACTQQRCAKFLNVEVRQASLAEGLPPGAYDLIVLGDFGCHFRPAPLLQLVSQMVGQLQPGGELVAAHSLLPRSAGLLYGDAVHYLLGARLPLDCMHSERHEDFRIDVWRRAR